MNAAPLLRTPEEVAALTGGHISPFTIRRLASQGICSYTKGARNKVLMSEGDIASLLEALKAPAAPAPGPAEGDVADVFKTTGRSTARGRKVS
jgi:hypothetical protein